MIGYASGVKYEDGKCYRSKDVVEVEIDEDIFLDKEMYTKIYPKYKTVEFIFKTRINAQCFLAGFEAGGYWMADPQREWDYYVNKCIDLYHGKDNNEQS